MSNQKSPYEILDVNEKAALEVIKKEYKTKSLKYHPNKITKLSENNKKKYEKEYEEKFKQINNAYEILEDPIKRYIYDNTNGNIKNKLERVKNYEVDFNVVEKFKTSSKNNQNKLSKSYNILNLNQLRQKYKLPNENNSYPSYYFIKSNESSTKTKSTNQQQLTNLKSYKSTNVIKLQNTPSPLTDKNTKSTNQQQLTNLKSNKSTNVIKLQNTPSPLTDKNKLVSSNISGNANAENKKIKKQKENLKNIVNSYKDTLNEKKNKFNTTLDTILNNYKTSSVGSSKKDDFIDELCNAVNNINLLGDYVKNLYKYFNIDLREASNSINNTTLNKTYYTDKNFNDIKFAQIMMGKLNNRSYPNNIAKNMYSRLIL